MRAQATTSAERAHPPCRRPYDRRRAESLAPAAPAMPFPTLDETAMPALAPSASESEPDIDREDVHVRAYRYTHSTHSQIGLIWPWICTVTENEFWV